MEIKLSPIKMNLAIIGISPSNFEKVIFSFSTLFLDLKTETVF
jgi:hypothetical protein